ncbi:FkbM family methyltransferase [Aurantiacibacter hainanensis]|uniref:FkbM family methyltransferase n=1 Tax=Aurantiacibacter hainanensis TaxID=3076114 RepID=UPI0030C70984
MRVFVDIGGYLGHSALAALDPIFNFDRVLCFEPVPHLAKQIRAIGNKKLLVVEAALSDREGRAILHHAGTLAGSLFAEAPSYGGETDPIEIVTLRASSFLSALLPSDAFVRTKFNCEGAEALIIRDILGSGKIELCEQILCGALIDFDIDKIERGQRTRTEIESALADRQITYWTPPECQYGMVTNYGAVRNYLILSGAALPGFFPRLRSLFYNLRLLKNPELNGYHKMKILKVFPSLRRFAKSVSK